MRAIERGLRLPDFDTMTIGMILDYITAFNNDRLDDDEDGIFEATQADFDRF